jgi:hypothetical protein
MNTLGLLLAIVPLLQQRPGYAPADAKIKPDTAAKLR